MTLWNSINGPIKGWLLMPKYKKDSFCCHSLSNLLTNTDTSITPFPEHKRCWVLHKNTPAWNQKKWRKAERKSLCSNRLFAYAMQACIVCILWETPTRHCFKNFDLFSLTLTWHHFKKRKIKYLLTTMLIFFLFSAYEEMIINHCDRIWSQ